MANATIDEIVEHISGLTAMELADLSKAIQDKFGVTAAAPVAIAGPAVGGGGEAVEEKTEFNVMLNAVGDKKIQVIKAVRELTSLGLKKPKTWLNRLLRPWLKALPRKMPKRPRPSWKKSALRLSSSS